MKFVAKRPTVSPTWGFGIPDALVVGYGLDSADMSYTIPHIAALKRGANPDRAGLKGKHKRCDGRKPSHRLYSWQKSTGARRHVFVHTETVTEDLIPG